jgi:hypothetical protein
LPKHERTQKVTKAVTELGNKLKQQANEQLPNNG